MPNTGLIKNEVEKAYHEPSRFAILCALCASDSGMTFNELKKDCGLTDGNLNGHLRILERAGAIKIKKTFVDLKPRTTVYLTEKGLENFADYVDTLARVLKKGKKALSEANEGIALLHSVKASV
jgi:DNA-binding MarR family transcriptional regulator